ncbi:MAG: TadE/TadG family type IV pilus assembly protein [Pirellulales bacterium]|nr:TadE/TadG family type IV pilus assembly protein [Pirellulales bacterium]
MLLEKVGPFWLVCLAIIAVLLLILRAMIHLSGARRRPQGIASLHGDQRGSVQSLSFVITLPIFILIMMGIVQVAQIMLAKVVVEYAALASTRAATVWVSQYISTESAYIEQRNCIGNSPLDRSDTPYTIPTENSTSAKISRIRMAAHLACLPICPSQWPYDEAPQLSTVPEMTHASLVKAYSAMAGEKNAAPMEAVSARLRRKLAYSEQNTMIKIEMEHPANDPPFGKYDYGYQVNRAYTLSDEDGGEELVEATSLPLCPGSRLDECDPEIYYAPAYMQEAFAFQPNEVGWQDRITITVHHDLALLPGPGKLLSRMIHGEDGSRGPGHSVAQQSTSTEPSQDNDQETDGTFYTWPLVAKASTINEGDNPILRYQHDFILHDAESGSGGGLGN